MYSCHQSASHLSLCLFLHPPLWFQYQKHFKAPTERSVMSHDTHLSQTHHEWNNWILFGGIYYKERSCVGRGPDIKGLRGWKRPRARQIERARWESESGHRMFESCSWDPDDRVVFGNLRARAQKCAFPPTAEWARKESFGFQSIHSFIYITYFHRWELFQREERTVFRFPMLWPLYFISLLRLWQCLCFRSDAHPRFACKDSACYW